MATEKSKVLDRLRGLCSRREYCSSEILKKAQTALDGDMAAAKDVVETLMKEKYVDDLRYSAAFARDKASISGWGEVKIRYMLLSKGISKDIISAALQEIDEEKAADKLLRIVEVKAKSLRDDPQVRLKLLRFALGRGYDYETTVNVIDKVLVKNDYEQI